MISGYFGYHFRKSPHLLLVGQIGWWQVPPHPDICMLPARSGKREWRIFPVWTVEILCYSPLGLSHPWLNSSGLRRTVVNWIQMTPLPPRSLPWFTCCPLVLITNRYDVCIFFTTVLTWLSMQIQKLKAHGTSRKRGLWPSLTPLFASDPALDQACGGGPKLRPQRPNRLVHWVPSEG